MRSSNVCRGLVSYIVSFFMKITGWVTIKMFVEIIIRGVSEADREADLYILRVQLTTDKTEVSSLFKHTVGNF